MGHLKYLKYPGWCDDKFEFSASAIKDLLWLSRAIAEKPYNRAFTRLRDLRSEGDDMVETWQTRSSGPSEARFNTSRVTNPSLLQLIILYHLMEEQNVIRSDQILKVIIW